MSDDIDRLLPPLANLRAVLSVRQERPAVNGGRVIVVSVELWDDWTAWHVSHIPSPDVTTGYLLFRMSDDLGTDYGPPAGGGAYSAGATQQTASVFMVPVPADARELRLTSGQLRPGEDVTVSLPPA